MFRLPDVNPAHAKRRKQDISALKSEKHFRVRSSLCLPTTTSLHSHAMPTFNVHSTAEEVAAAFSAQIAGKIILVTGVSKGGLGEETVRVIAQHSPRLIVLAGRSKAK